MDPHRLPRLHFLDLGLLEVRLHPDVIGLCQCEELLPGRDLGVQLSALVADDAILRSVDPGVLEIQLGLVGLCFGRLRTRRALGHRCPLRGDLARQVLLGLR